MTTSRFTSTEHIKVLHSTKVNHRAAYHTAHQVGLEVDAVVDVVAAAYVDGYRIELSFSDGHRQRVDFEPFLSQSLHPEIRAYLDVERFKQFDVKHGNLVWDDYALFFPVADLYAGRI